VLTGNELPSFRGSMLPLTYLPIDTVPLPKDLNIKI